MEVVLQMDPFKTESLRSTTQILSFLGDIGGFNNALRLMMGTFGTFFSARFFLASISNYLYLRRSKNYKENSSKAKEEQNNAKNRAKLVRRLSIRHSQINKTFTEDQPDGQKQKGAINLTKIHMDDSGGGGGVEDEAQILQQQIKKLSANKTPVNDLKFI
mmetsp:Transcript_11629/g.17645  ORF Transcript_11629/g.17645 Transcript_11629/m.17645 type:complete len:160 (+) Transcript_11629:2274-2753(+)